MAPVHRTTVSAPRTSVPAPAASFQFIVIILIIVILLALFGTGTLLRIYALRHRSSQLPALPTVEVNTAPASPKGKAPHFCNVKHAYIHILIFQRHSAADAPADTLQTLEEGPLTPSLPPSCEDADLEAKLGPIPEWLLPHMDMIRAQAKKAWTLYVPPASTVSPAVSAVPSIVIDPCTELSPPSTPSSTSSSYSLDSPSLTTPTSAFFIPVSPSILPAAYLQVPPMSWTAPRSIMEEEPLEEPVVSNVSGKTFALGAPPTRKGKKAQARPAGVHAAGVERDAGLGLLGRGAGAASAGSGLGLGLILDSGADRSKRFGHLLEGAVAVMLCEDGNEDAAAIPNYSLPAVSSSCENDVGSTGSLDSPGSLGSPVSLGSPGFSAF
ncbi:hypothetical protein A0H81_02419 [Grifola frondosa]|uniref:Uncharacterized protein n=1 Tax=Grifola frondosa TaxID=5627 RepID=A0A1C7MRX1_GRIFR|nr:hypothetical protein A0H81_02419 [Grifola frondosa]